MYALILFAALAAYGVIVLVMWD